MNFLFSIKDLIDILLVAAILFGGFRLLKKNGAVNLFWGILAFICIWFLVSFIFHLELTGALFDRIVEVGALALIIIFQNEIRSFIYSLGGRFSNNRLFRRLKGDGTMSHSEQSIRAIATACQHMSRTKTGALIILLRHQELTEYVDTGEKIDSAISARLIEQIFYKNTPLHDGALLIGHDRLISAACILPVSQDQYLPNQYGLRHRAALGVTEKTDALAIVVSEETGFISLASGEHMNTVAPEKLAEAVQSELEI